MDSKSKFSDIDSFLLINLMEEKQTASDISKQFGLTESEMYRAYRFFTGFDIRQCKTSSLSIYREICELRNNHIKWDAIAAKFYLTQGGLMGRFNKLKKLYGKDGDIYNAHTKKPISRERFLEMKKYRETGMTWKEIGKKLNKTEGSVSGLYTVMSRSFC